MYYKTQLNRWPYLFLVLADLFALYYLKSSRYLTLYAFNIFTLAVLHRRLIWIILSTAPRDLTGLFALIRLQKKLRMHKRLNNTVNLVFRQNVAAYGDRKLAFIDMESGRQWTFAEVDAYSNQIANFFRKKGYRKGDVVALYMHNSADFVCCWLGLSKIGVITALINHNLRGQPFGHSIAVGNAQAIIVGGDLQKELKEAIDLNFIKSSLPVFVYKTTNNEQIILGDNLRAMLAQTPSTAPNMSKDEHAGFRDVLFYVYTSGTTGLPKAAVITHARYFMMAHGIFNTYKLSHDDRLYVVLPLYHSAGNILGIGQTLVNGCTSVIRKKFSASRFWDDAIEYNCTLSQYIGETCRYLLAQPPRPVDRSHPIRFMYGNGLRGGIWEQFVARFGIKRIGEFYGSTEGNASLLNLDNKPGSCGFLPYFVLHFLHFAYPLSLMKIDQHTGELVRNADGLCVPCKPGETGEIIGKIVKNDPLKDFVGYVSGKDTKKKVVQNVYRKGDVAFSSGDVLHMDKYGYLYFKDRNGDTFRWKGENVSTNEVESVLQRAVGMSDATVYGVEIPGTDGKAGMAAIVDLNQNIDLKHLSEALKDRLPAYARPVFVRLCKKVDTTGTYKLIKQDLQKAGYDPLKCNSGDKLYYMNSKTGHYETLGPEEFRAITAGRVKF